jgi:hypothetical protein
MAAAENPIDTAATVTLGRHVRPGCEQEYLAWEQGLKALASRCPGFIDADIHRPAAEQPSWAVVYRFDTTANLWAWLNSATRAERSSDGDRFFDRPPTQQVIPGNAKPPTQLVTTAVTHRVDPHHVEDFLQWQQRFRLAQSSFPGFRSQEVFRPIDGVQDQWTVLDRYDTAADHGRWLTSPERQQLLAEGKHFGDFDLHTIDNPFGSWFPSDQNRAEAPPSDTKTAIAVWVGLYPSVVLLTLALSPLKMALWLGTLLGTLVSSLFMTFAVMPYYVNPLLKHWLRPPPEVPKTRTHWRGIGVIAAVMAAWTLLIYLMTRVFWHLP